jgi:S-adenosylmethionine synthetase
MLHAVGSTLGDGAGPAPAQGYRGSDEREIPGLRPDCRSQASVCYESGAPNAIDAAVVSTQRDEDVACEALKEAVMETIIKPVVPAEMLSAETTYFVNPTGRFVMGGAVGD